MLEVIAALVILSLGASIAFTWLSQTLVTIGRLRAQEAELIARIDTVEYLRSLNPQTMPTGSTRVAQYRIDWTSIQTGPALPTKSRFNGNGLYNVSLYVVTAKVYDLAGKPWFDTTLPVAGYQQVSRASDVSPLQLSGGNK